jgi:hypothetical protein
LVQTAASSSASEVWIKGPLAHQSKDAKYGSEVKQKSFDFIQLSSLYFFRAVTSFGEYGAERGENRPAHRFGSQELFAKTPANIGDFPHSDFGERDFAGG